MTDAKLTDLVTRLVRKLEDAENRHRWRLRSAPAAVQGETPKPSVPPPGRLTVDVKTVTATLDGETYQLPYSSVAIFLARIVEANGQWVSGTDQKPKESDRPYRLIKALPQPIHARIEAKTGSGYRLKLV